MRQHLENQLLLFLLSLLNDFFRKLLKRRIQLAQLRVQSRQLLHPQAAEDAHDQIVGNLFLSKGLFHRLRQLWKVLDALRVRALGNENAAEE